MTFKAADTLAGYPDSSDGKFCLYCGGPTASAAHCPPWDLRGQGLGWGCPWIAGLSLLLCQNPPCQAGWGELRLEERVAISGEDGCLRGVVVAKGDPTSLRAPLQGPTRRDANSVPASTPHPLSLRAALASLPSLPAVTKSAFPMNLAHCWLPPGQTGLLPAIPSHGHTTQDTDPMSGHAQPNAVWWALRGKAG